MGKFIWISLVIILFILITTSYKVFDVSLLEILTYNTYKNTKEISTSINDKINTGKCPINIIPKNLTLVKYDSLGSSSENELRFHRDIRYNWADGQNIERDPNIFYKPVCVRGSKQGESINYYYCNDLWYTKKETNISGEGVIGKTQVTSYIINLVLKPATKIQDEGLLQEGGELIQEGELKQKEVINEWQGEGFYQNVKIGEFEVVGSSCIKK